MILNIKNYIKDQVRRTMDRYFGKTVRVVLGRKKIKKRIELTKNIREDDTLPTTNFETLGYSRIECDRSITKDFIERCKQRLGEIKEFKQRGGKAFFSQLLTSEDYELNSPIMKFALNEKLLHTIAKHLGSAPFLQSVELLYSRPISGPPRASQLWHRDRLDKKVMKVVVYCLDVGPKNGPFTFIPKSSGEKVPEWHFHYISDEKMRKYVDDLHIQKMEGPAGSTLLIDTFGCYHKGSNCQEPRLAAIIDFDTGFGYQKRRGQWKVPPEKIDTLSALQKFALGDF